MEGKPEYPEWINTNFFLINVIHPLYPKDLSEIIEYTLKSAYQPGESYSSRLYRVFIKFTINSIPKSLSLFLKIHPKGLTGITAKQNQLFAREIFFYKDILPKINDMLLQLNYPSQLCPKCFLTINEPEEMLIFEDLKQKNFELYKKGTLLDLNHTILLLKKLAKLHACSAVIYANNSNIMDFFLEGPISSNPNRQYFLPFFTANFRCLYKEVSQWSGFEEISSKIADLERTIIPRGIEMFLNQKSPFKVLNQADVWINNFLFRYNNKIPEEVILIDFQLTYFGSPAIDINNLLYGSVDVVTRKTNLPKLLEGYSLELQETLKQLNFKGYIPTTKDIHDEMIKNSLSAIISAVCITPLILMEANNFSTLEGLFDGFERGDIFRLANIKNPKYLHYIRETLKEFEESGFFEYF